MLYNILNISTVGHVRYCNVTIVSINSQKELQIFSIRHNTKNLHEFYFLCGNLLFTIII